MAGVRTIGCFTLAQQTTGPIVKRMSNALHPEMAIEGFCNNQYLYECEEGVGVGVPVGAEVRARVGPVAVVEDTS